MFGEPKDVEGDCNAHLYIGDDCGDNHATMRCQLPKGHEGMHCEEFKRDGGQVVVTWEKDEREEPLPEKVDAMVESVEENEAIVSFEVNGKRDEQYLMRTDLEPHGLFRVGAWLTLNLKTWEAVPRPDLEDEWATR